MHSSIPPILAAFLVVAAQSPVRAERAPCLSLDSKVSLTGTVLRQRDASASAGAKAGRSRTYYVLSLDTPACIERQQSSLPALQIEFRRFAFKRKWQGRHVSISGNLFPARSADQHTPVVIRSDETRIAPFQAGSFPLASCEGWNATITELIGVNTAQARVRGVVTAADIRDYCARDREHVTIRRGGKLTEQQCMERSRASIGRRPAVTAVTADCEQGLIGIGSEREYQLVQRKGETDNDIEFAWREIRTGQTLDGSCASRAPLLSQQFRLLCPGRSSGGGDQESGTQESGTQESGTQESGTQESGIKGQ
jgi:hypothetical protein